MKRKRSCAGTPLPQVIKAGKEIMRLVEKLPELNSTFVKETYDKMSGDILSDWLDKTKPSWNSGVKTGFQIRDQDFYAAKEGFRIEVYFLMADGEHKAPKNDLCRELAQFCGENMPKEMVRELWIIQKRRDVDLENTIYEGEFNGT